MSKNLVFFQKIFKKSCHCTLIYITPKTQIKNIKGVFTPIFPLSPPVICFILCFYVNINLSKPYTSQNIREHVYPILSK